MLIEEPGREPLQVVVVPIGSAAEQEGLGIVADLRRATFACDMAFRGNMKKRMQRADASGARYAVIFGEDELASGFVQLKHLKSGEQTRVLRGELTRAIFAGLEDQRISDFGQAKS